MNQKFRVQYIAKSTLPQVVSQINSYERRRKGEGKGTLEREHENMKNALNDMLHYLMQCQNSLSFYDDSV